MVGQGDVAPVLAAAAELPADALVIVPVRNFVLFPEVVSPLAIGRPLSINAAQAAARESRPIGVLTQQDAAVDEPSAAQMHRMGTLANVLRYVTARALPSWEVPNMLAKYYTTTHALAMATR